MIELRHSAAAPPNGQTIAERIAEETTVVAYNRAAYGASSRARVAGLPPRSRPTLTACSAALGLSARSFSSAIRSAALTPARRRVGIWTGSKGWCSSIQATRGRGGRLPADHPFKKRAAGVAVRPPNIVSERSRERGCGPAVDFPGVPDVQAADRRRRFRWRSDGLGERPLAVLTRGPEGPADSDRLWQAWHGLQRELAGLSRNSRHLISVSPQHYLNEDDPDLIVAAVIDVIRCARDAAGLGDGRGRLQGEPRDRSE